MTTFWTKIEKIELNHDDDDDEKCEERERERERDFVDFFFR